jgi:glycosyltransferase involved in cell wall biosynthesis
LSHQVAGSPERLRVVLWGTCDMGKPRARILRAGLEANGVEVIDCRTDPWAGVEDKSQIRGPWRWLRLGMAVMVSYPILLWRYLRLPAHDWILVGYPAVIDVFAIAWLARLRGVPVAMDWFLSAYDTVVLDRRLVSKRHPLAWALRALEWCAVRVATVAFMDTAAHARRMERLYHRPVGSIGRVWVGVEPGAFLAAQAADSTLHTATQRFTVLFYGQFIPLHGIGTIVQAARDARALPIDWILVGTGQEAGRVSAMLEADPLPRLTWIPWVPYARLRDYIGTADVCLGIFGTSDKADSVVPNKVFQVLCAGRPLITRDSAAIRELLPRDGADVDLVAPGDPSALAAAVVRRFERHATVPGDGCNARPACVGPADVGLQFLQLIRKDVSHPDVTQTNVSKETTQ